MARKTLKAKVRKTFGRKVKRLRQEDKIPGNVFGSKTQSQALTLDKKELLAIFEEAGETNLVDLKVKGEKEARPVLITNIQIHPVTNKALHVDLHQVDLTQKTKADIPVVTKGKAPATEKGGILVLFLNEIEVEALPTDLPEEFSVDISKLEEIGDTLLVKDLKVDKSKLELLVEEKEPVVSIQEPEEEEEPEPVETEEVEEGEEGAEETEGEEGEQEEGEKEKAEGEQDKGKEEKQEDKKA